MNALNKVDANRPTATRIVDGSDYAIELDLTPIAAGLLNDIARALRGNGHLFTLLANNPVGSPEHTKIRQSIMARLSMTTALQVVLGPDQAEALQADLLDATVEPSLCEGPCGGENYAARPDRLCEADGAAADFSADMYAHLRAV